MSFASDFVSDCTQLARMRETCLKEERESDEHVTETFDGVEMTLKYAYSDRRQTIRSVFVDGVSFAAEYEFVPWNIFKPITVSYHVYLGLTYASAEALIREAGLDPSLSLSEEYYPPENGPALWMAYVDKLEEVAALWKAWAPKYHIK